jgi:hypothetical protein
MMSKDNDSQIETLALLKKLSVKAESRARRYGDMRYRLDPPSEQLAERVPTLARDSYKPITPMLRARFEFAGCWVLPESGKTWLTIEEMESIWNSSRILSQIEIRKQNWTDSIVARFPTNQLSLFGLDLPDYNETYLHWTETSLEPEVHSYYGAEENVYSDFREFLKHLIT